ncbi:uncharacterized protein RJT20DRAFT_134057 [Scheffersomyces xylosifermentans]|uniref:uncharacterized protein n=1 Tax=Scheffersomyces xylosifermentans TaxID=1304137 RepID=UPI00315D1380
MHVHYKIKSFIASYLTALEHWNYHFKNPDNTPVQGPESKFNKEEFKTIILDECHHAVARTWLRVLQYFGADKPGTEIYVLGFIATLERADNVPLSTVFDEIVYERSTAQMIEEGDLSQMKFSTIDIDVDFGKVEVTEVDPQNGGQPKTMDLKQANLVVSVAYLQMREERF